MAKTAQQIVDQAEIILHDTSNTRWSEAELLYYVNEGMREIVRIDATAYVKESSVQLVAGPAQSAPSDANEIFDVTRNMGRTWVTATAYVVDDIVYNSSTRYKCLVAHTSGTFATDLSSSYWETNTWDESGPNIEQIPKLNLDVYLGRGWISDDPDDEALVTFWIPNEMNPLKYWVYPQQPSTGMQYVEIKYSAFPDDIAIGAEITVGNRYESALLDYIVFRAYSKDIDTPENQNVASIYYNKFLNNPVFRLIRR
jgi:hypothetical protein